MGFVGSLGVEELRDKHISSLVVDVHDLTWLWTLNRNLGLAFIFVGYFSRFWHANISDTSIRNNLYFVRKFIDKVFRLNAMFAIVRIESHWQDEGVVTAFYL